MACFIAPVTEAIVTTVVTKIVKVHEKKREAKATQSVSEVQEANTVEASAVMNDSGNTSCKRKFSEKLSWLNSMLWGGSLLLAFEHVWHGEVVPWYPFLTAMSDPESTWTMVNEIATTGVFMAVAITAVWVCMVVASNIIEKHAVDNSKATSDSNL